MMERTGLKLTGPAAHSPVPGTAAAIADGYAAAATSLFDALRSSWTDETLQQSDEMYGEPWKRGLTLTALVTHQAHHRGTDDGADAAGRAQGAGRLRPRARGVGGHGDAAACGLSRPGAV